MSNLDALILLPHLQISNANMISGPISWGFPAVTAFCGMVHQLMRLSPEMPFAVNGVGIVCHSFEEQASRPMGSYVHSLHLNRYPVKKDGESASLIEEGRIHCEVSLLVGVHFTEDFDHDDGEKFARQLQEKAYRLRLAGGSIHENTENRYQARWLTLSDSQEEQEKEFRRIRHFLMPGFALMDRRDLLASHCETLQSTNPDIRSLDAFLDLVRLNFEPSHTEGETGECHIRKKAGWLVPLPVGYRAISELYPAGTVKNARDGSVPFRFVESLYSLGEWKSPHRIRHPKEMLWQYCVDEEQGLYHCMQQKNENH